MHQHTQSVVMVFTDGDGWPNIEVSKDQGWDLPADEAVPLMHKILEDHYPAGGTIIRAMAAAWRQAASLSPIQTSTPLSITGIAFIYRFTLTRGYVL